MADWSAIKAEYLAGTSFAELGRRYGLNKATICRKAQKEGWQHVATTLDNEVQRKTIEKISDRISDHEAEIAQLKNETRLLLWRVTKQRIGSITEDTNSSDIRRYVQNYVDLLGVDPVSSSEDTENSGLIDALNNVSDVFDDGDDADFLPPQGVEDETG